MIVFIFGLRHFLSKIAPLSFREASIHQKLPGGSNAFFPASGKNHKFWWTEAVKHYFLAFPALAIIVISCVKYTVYPDNQNLSFETVLATVCASDILFADFKSNQDVRV